MKMFKKLAAAGLATALIAACFTGCGKGDAEKAYFIGATGPLTGSAMSYGMSVQNGAKLAVDEINAAGGLNGVKFKFEILDDKATPEDASVGYDQLYDKGMQVSAR